MSGALVATWMGKICLHRLCLPELLQFRARLAGGRAAIKSQRQAVKPQNSGVARSLGLADFRQGAALARRNAAREENDRASKDERAIRQAALITLRRAIRERLPALAASDTRDCGPFRW